MQDRGRAATLGVVQGVLAGVLNGNVGGTVPAISLLVSVADVNGVDEYPLPQSLSPTPSSPIMR